MFSAIRAFAYTIHAAIKTIFAPVIVLQQGATALIIFYAAGIVALVGAFLGWRLEVFLILTGLAFLVDEIRYLYSGPDGASYKPIYWALKGIFWCTGLYYILQRWVLK